MKVFVILSFIAIFGGTINLFSQEIKLSLSVKNKTLKEAFKIIEKESNFRFFYSDDFQDLNKKINITLRNKNIDDIMHSLLGESTLTYKALDNYVIVITPISNPLLSQNKTISGKVVDAFTDDPLTGVNVLIEGTTNGVITNSEGNYIINISGDNPIIVFSYIGYTSQTIAVFDKTVINIQLSSNLEELEEVVVVGYGTMKKRDLTGALSSIKGDELEISSDISVGGVLSGRIAGLQISQISAQPGGDMNFQIRGATSMEAGNDPLFIVDGFPITGLNEAVNGPMGVTGVTSPLNFLNLNDIESIEVLKDASSTAIFGARASNGVILITTKRGKEGKTLVQFSSSYSVQTIAKNYDLLNSSEYMKEYNSMSKESFMITNGIYPYGTNLFDDVQATIGDPYKDKYSASQINNPPVNTDWIDLVTREGMINQNNIRISGGSKSTRYSLSANIYKNEGVVKNSQMERFSSRLNMDQDIGKYITTGVNLTISTLKISNVRLGPDTDRQAGILGAAMIMSPLVVPVDADGNFPLDPNFAYTPNPYSLLKRTDDSDKDELLAYTFIEIKPITNLKLRVNLGVNRGIAQRGTYAPKTTIEGSQNDGVASLSELNKADYLSELTANYMKTFNEKNNLSILGGYSYQKFNSNSFYVSNSGYITDNFTYNALGIAENRAEVQSVREENKLVSFFGRVNYNYKNKYLLTATIRRDGATRFADNNKWGTFPSIAVGWNMQEERFFKPFTGVINYFKLRASFGQTGNSNIGSYAFGSYNLYPAFVFGSSIVTGIFPSRFANPDLKWETANEYNFGLDFGLWKNRISGALEIFNKSVSDILRLNKPLQPYQEISTIAANAGKTQSKGLELSVSAKLITKGDFRWTSTLVFSFYRDRWKNRYDDWRPAIYENINDPLRAWFDYENDGIMSIEEFQNYGAPSYYPELLPGMVKIKDINGYRLNEEGNPEVDSYGKFILSGIPDGKINDADKVLKGTLDPGYIAGISTSFTYKRFDLNFNFYGMFDRNMVDPNFYAITDMSAYGSNTNRLNMYRWQYDNPDTKYPGIAQAQRAIYGYGGYMMQNTWFIRMRNLNVGYSIPVSWSKNIISDCRVYADFQNLFTITPYTGMDPEIDNASDQRLFFEGLSTVNSAAYPSVRTFTLGIDISF